MKRISTTILLFALIFGPCAPVTALNSNVPPSGVDSFSFLYFGDIQVTQSAEEDFSAWGRLAVNALARNPDAEFALQGGDIVENGRSAEQWDAFLDNADTALGELPFFPTPGNHDSNFPSGKPEQYLERFDLPQNGPEGFVGEFYSFDYGDAHILSLNSWVFSGEQELRDEDYARIDAWVAYDLARSDAKWKIVLTHIPVYDIYPDETSTLTREHWAELFEKYGVSLVLVGHQHVYSRLMPLTGGKVDCADGVTQIMSNSGRKHYQVADETLAEKTIYNIATYQSVRVNGDTLTVRTFDEAGNELDRVMISPRETSVTRGEYIETLWRAAGSPRSGLHVFTDVPRDDAAIAWAYEEGFIIGYGDGLFGPDDKITREQIGIILSRLF